MNFDLNQLTVYYSDMGCDRASVRVSIPCTGLPPHILRYHSWRVTSVKLALARWEFKVLSVTPAVAKTLLEKLSMGGKGQVSLHFLQRRGRKKPPADDLRALVRREWPQLHPLIEKCVVKADHSTAADLASIRAQAALTVARRLFDAQVEAAWARAIQQEPFASRLRELENAIREVSRSYLKADIGAKFRTDAVEQAQKLYASSAAREIREALREDTDDEILQQVKDCLEQLVLEGMPPGKLTGSH